MANPQVGRAANSIRFLCPSTLQESAMWLGRAGTSNRSMADQDFDSVPLMKSFGESLRQQKLDRNKLEQWLSDLVTRMLNTSFMTRDSIDLASRRTQAVNHVKVIAM